MDRLITNIGESIYEWMLSAPGQKSMVAIAKLAAAMFGTNTTANGLSCAPTSPASLQVVVNPGEIYSLANLEASACGTLPIDSTHQILKQGILLDVFTTSTLAAPGTAGQSINYLIEAQYADSDVSIDPTTGSSPVVLQFYNSTNPTQPFSGPGGNGQTSTTFRKGIVSLQVKAGAAATTGTQATPSPDAGWVGLWVVTVANGQSTITSGNIAQYAGAPILPSSLLASIQNGNLSYAVATGTANVHTIALTPALTARVDGMMIRYKAPAANTGAVTLADGVGTANVLGANHAALQGGEYIANGDAIVIWNSSISGGSYILVECTGGAIQIAPATASQHAVQLGQVGHGQCRLSVTNTTTLTLAPYNGNNLIINGVPRQIPSAGVTLSNGGLSASTLYYIYASWTGSAIQLNASATGHSTATNGIETKTGDTTQTLVGMIYTNASTQFVDSAASRTCLNWFNRRKLIGSVNTSGPFSFTSTSVAELTSTVRAQFLMWADDTPLAHWSSYGSQTSGTPSATTLSFQLYMDGTTQYGPALGIVIQPSWNQLVAQHGALGGLSEGLHYSTLFVSVGTNGGTLTVNNIQNAVNIFG